MRHVQSSPTAGKDIGVPDDILNELRSICLRFPETCEESAWVGTRWMIRQKNFAHVLAIVNGWPPAYAEAAGSDGPMYVLTFRTLGRESEPSEFAYYPFFRPVWFNNIVGMVIDDEVDWSEIGDMLAISYGILAPKKLAEQLNRKVGG